MSHSFTSPHHDDSCDVELRYTRKPTLDDPPMRSFWCNTHGQWTYEYPVSAKYTFKDGKSKSWRR